MSQQLYIVYDEVKKKRKNISIETDGTIHNFLNDKQIHIFKTLDDFHYFINTKIKLGDEVFEDLSYAYFKATQHALNTLPKYYDLLKPLMYNEGKA